MQRECRSSRGGHLTLPSLLLTILLSGLSEGAASSGSAEADGISFGRNLQKALDASLRVTRGTGISAAVSIPNRGTWTGASGNSQPGEPVAADMAFDIASVGKNFVAVLVLQLAEEGKLSLDDPLGKWLPEYAHINPAITIRQLLNHTSGVFDWVEHRQSPYRRPFDRIDFAVPSSPDEVVRTLVAEPYFPPGRGFRYSTTNYTLLRMIVEKATSSTVAQELRTRFLEPLNLKHTVVLDSAAPLPQSFRVAHAWWDADGDGAPDDISGMPTAWIATRSPADVYSTAGDLARWSRAIWGGEVLSQESRAQLLTFHRPVPTAPGEPLATGYGLGTEEFRMAGREMWGHLGWQYGYTAAMLYIPRHSVSLVVLINDNNMLLINVATVALWLVLEFHLAPASFLALVASILLLGSVLIVWPVSYVSSAWRRRKSPLRMSEPGINRGPGVARFAAVLATLTIATATVLYLLCSLNPAIPLNWKAGSSLVKFLIGFVVAGLGLSLCLTFLTIRAWQRSYWSALGRIHFTLITAAAWVAVYAILGIFSW